jgi:hypothetical protein
MASRADFVYGVKLFLIAGAVCSCLRCLTTLFREIEVCAASARAPAHS